MRNTAALRVAACDTEDQLHQRLQRFNLRRLAPQLEEDRTCEYKDSELRSDERRFVEEERRGVGRWLDDVPTSPSEFLRWFDELRSHGPGQGDPLFPWLASSATHEQMQWFLGQELAGEAGFEDLVALTQLKFPARAKLEMARNFWDEMGRGQRRGMHGPMLDRLAEELDATSAATPVWESLALANLMAALALNRHYAYQSVGALGVIELTAPERARQINAGLKRLGVPGVARQYFALHATLDVKHSRAWNEEVLGPIVADEPRAARLIAEGALMRLTAGARCFARYRLELGITPATGTRIGRPAQIA